MTQTITAREARFAVHIPTRHYDVPDVHLIKEALHLADGTIVPNVRLINNFKRPFWIVQKSKQTYDQKKEWETKENLNEFSCTQSELRYAIAKAFDKPWSKEHLKQLSASPYLYGSDVTSTAYLKMQYMKKWPDATTPYSIATLDIETDVVHGTKQIIMLTIILREKEGLVVKTYVLQEYLSGYSNPIERIDAKMDEYLGEYVKRLNIRSETILCETEIEIVEESFKQLHLWKPDFLSIWNMDYDVPKIVEACEKVGVDPKDIFCDPIVPKELRMFKYMQGPKKKVTASGVVKPINPADQWHSVLCPSSFFIIDAMCSYRQIRLAKQALLSYSLDSVLQEELGIRKLKFEAADKYVGLRWHQFMQTEYKIEYIIYNRFDCISMIELENKIKDLSFTLPGFAGSTDFAKFNSQPKKIADAMFMFLENEGRVPGTVGPSAKPGEETEEDDNDDPEILSLQDWIITLPAHLMADNGLKCIAEDPTMRTNIRAYNADSDAVSSYPSDMSACNVSKETTQREIITIESIPEEIFRLQNINLLSGHVNAVEYCVNMFNFPTPDQALRQFENDLMN